MAYADDIIIASTHTQARVQPRNTYNHTYTKFLPGQNKKILLLNPDKTTCTLFPPDPAEYTSNLDLTITNKALKSYYNIAPTYLCELISRRESYVNTRLGSDQHQLIMPPISKDCSNIVLERSFTYAAPCEWNKLSECIRTSSFDSFRKSVKTMLFTQQYG